MNLFYFAVNIDRRFFQSTLVCLQIEEFSVGLFSGIAFCICSHIHEVSTFNCVCLIDYKS